MNDNARPSNGTHRSHLDGVFWTCCVGIVGVISYKYIGYQLHKAIEICVASRLVLQYRETHTIELQSMSTIADR